MSRHHITSVTTRNNKETTNKKRLLYNDVHVMEKLYQCSEVGGHVV